MPLVDIPEAEEKVEVPADAIEVQDGEDLVIKSQGELDDTIQSRLSRQERKLKSDLKSDDEFWREMAAERGVQLRDDGKSKGAVRDEELEELRTKANKAESLQQKLEEQEDRIQSSREERLEGTLLEKAPGFANETARETYIREVKSRMTYDEDYGWVEQGDEGGVAFEGGDPRGPESVIADLEDSHSFLFESTTVEGGSDVSPGGSVSGDTLTKAEFDQERERAMQRGDDERLAELEEMAANDQIES